jgi:histidinol-phosphatase (PHP family)
VIVDYHMHLRAPDESIDHSLQAVERFVEVAAERSVDEIGFSEHVYYFEQTRSLWSVSDQVERSRYDLDRYVDAVVEAKRRGFPVKLGLEVDHQPHLADEMDEILEPYPWDYLIGSIHFVDGIAIDQAPSLVDTVGAEEAWGRYYDWLVDASRRFDILAHPDLVKMYGPEIEWDWGRLASSLGGACLEVSSAGLHKPHGKLYPNAGLLEAGRERGIPITLASDAHVPQDVGRDLDKAIEHAQAAGYETVTVFDRRRPRQEPLG